MLDLHFALAFWALALSLLFLCASHRSVTCRSLWPVARIVLVAGARCRFARRPNFRSLLGSFTAPHFSTDNAKIGVILAWD